MWSKMKHNIEEGFSKKLNCKIQIYSTSYGRDIDTQDYHNRAWITVDGEEVVSFTTARVLKHQYEFYHQTTPTDCARSNRKINRELNDEELVDRTEFTKYDFTNCCYSFLQMSIEESVNHDSPIIRALAVLDRRIGKRRLSKLNELVKDPLVRYFLDIRLESESIGVNKPEISVKVNHS